VNAPWQVTYDRGTAFVVGPKAEARRRIAACGDNAPQWIARRSAWATSPAVANKVLDQLEARNVGAAVEHTDQGAFDLSETVPANVAPMRRQEALW